jgi:prolyl oligopeptidase family protein
MTPRTPISSRTPRRYSRPTRSSARCSSARGRTIRGVKQAESEQIVDAIIKNNGSVTYVVYPDEGHGFVRPENRIDFNARVEAFLGANLGGRTEPVAGGKVPGSTAVVKVIEKGKPVLRVD